MKKSIQETMTKNFLRNLVILCAFSFLIFACKSTYLQESVDVSKQKKKYDKILIIGKTKSDLARVKFENKMVSLLKDQGVNAIASRNVKLTEDISAKLSDTDLSELNEHLIEAGFDGAVITHLVSTEDYQTISQNSFSTRGRYQYYGRFGRYYNHYEPMHWEQEVRSGTHYYLESSLYSLNQSQNDNLQWVGRFKITDPTVMSNIIDKYGSELTLALIENSISVN